MTEEDEKHVAGHETDESPAPKVRECEVKQLEAVSFVMSAAAVKPVSSPM